MPPRRLNGALSQKDSQYGHELKRRDQELFKLRERMVKILSADRKTSSKTIKTMQGSMEVSYILEFHKLLNRHQGGGVAVARPDVGTQGWVNMSINLQ